ncbi:hypothetical protein L1987_77466 [Smallanthus sonchifolius]|uniref:Uncharacterized protein n=1 Tax=Smallanthus sonchifolius TaxID=185202 RepID=A0ACB8ZAH6_9ASTR|nr:hypothetical protein L1987_77466 [Smallanthus sonchifolius]
MDAACYFQLQLLLNLWICKPANPTNNSVCMFSLRKKIEDSVNRDEVLGLIALEFEEARRVKQEKMIRDYDLWDDLAKSSDILIKLADSAKVVDALKDLTYKVEEAKLITELAEMDIINYALLKQAYTASVDIWAEQLVGMYMKWAKKQGLKGRIVEKNCRSKAEGGIKSVIIEFEQKYAYGYFLGEKGTHRMITSHPESISEVSSAAVDIVPLGVQIPVQTGGPNRNQAGRHIMAGLRSPFSSKTAFWCSPVQNFVKSGGADFTDECGVYRYVFIKNGVGERNQFSNKMKALNRLKAKLLVVSKDQGVSNITNIKKDTVIDHWQQETGRVSDGSICEILIDP